MSKWNVTYTVPIMSDEQYTISVQLEGFQESNTNTREYLARCKIAGMISGRMTGKSTMLEAHQVNLIRMVRV